MPAIDVFADVLIAASPADVAAVMFDPAREPEWIGAVQSIELIDAALVAGARVRHQGRIAGRDVSWISQVSAVHFPHKLTMEISAGPFAGVLDYSVARTADGTVARVRNAGDFDIGMPLPAALVAGEVRAALAKDLARLKALVENA
jgi:hypothetical protein